MDKYNYQNYQAIENAPAARNELDNYTRIIIDIYPPPLSSYAFLFTPLNLMCQLVISYFYSDVQIYITHAAAIIRVLLYI